MIHVSTLNWAGGSVEQLARRQFGQYVYWQEKSGSKMAIIWYDTEELGVTMHGISSLSLDYDHMKIFCLVKTIMIRIKYTFQGVTSHPARMVAWTPLMRGTQKVTALAYETPGLSN